MNLTPPQVSNKTTKVNIAGSRFSAGEIVLLLIFIGLVGWYLVKPKYNEWSKHKDELSTVQADLKKLQDTKAQILKLHTDLYKEENKDPLIMLEEGVPLDGKATRIYILMEGLVKNTGMTLGSMSVEPLTSLSSDGANGVKNRQFDGDRKLVTNTISINITGSMQQFVEFLHILENNPRIFDVTTIDIGGDQEDQLSFKLAVNAFSYSK